MTTESIHDDDLVTLNEASTILGAGKRNYFTQIEFRTRHGHSGADSTFPAPKVVGRSRRLWSLEELKDWLNTRNA